MIKITDGVRLPTMTTESTSQESQSHETWPRRRWMPPAAILAAAGLLLSFFWYSQTVRIPFGIFPQPPMYGRFRPVFQPELCWMVPPGLALVAVSWLITSTRGNNSCRVPTWLALPGVVAAGVGAAAAVAVVRGDWQALIRGVSTEPRTPYYTTELHFVHEYGVIGYIRHHAELVSRYYTDNPKTHPPGALVLLNGLFELLGSSHPLRITTALAAIALCAAVGAWSIGRTLGGERAGRIAAVLFVAAPGPLMLAYTSLDAIYAVLLSAAVATFMIAIHRSSVRLAALAGAVLGVATLTTFVTSLVAIAVAVAVMVQVSGWRRVFAMLAAAAGGGLAVLVVARVTVGFDLLGYYQAVPRSSTPFSPYWLGGHPVSMLTWAGLPLAALGVAGLLIRVPGARRAVLPLALVGIMIVWGMLPAAITGLRYGEVERTWAFLYPVLAGAAGPVIDRWTRGSGRWAGAIVGGLVVLSLAQTALIQSLWDNLL